MALPPIPTEIPLPDAAERYLEVCRRKVLIRRLSPATVRNYTADLHRFLELLPDAEAHTTESVTGLHIDEVLLAYANTADHRRRPGPGETVQDPRRRMATTDTKAAGSTLRMRRSLSGFFAYCVDQAFATVSPMRTSEMEPKDEGKLRVERTSLDLEQAQALLTHGPGDDTTNVHHDRDAIALALMGVLGLRAGEIVGLDTDHYTPATPNSPGSLQIYGKGRTWRTVPLPPWLEAVIVAYRARLGSAAPAALLLSPTGNRLAVRDIERLLERAVKRTRAADPAHARAVVPHGLRHTAATLMLAEGWDVKVVAQLLGHASVSTTSKYLDELPGGLSVAINAHPLIPTQPNPRHGTAPRSEVAAQAVADS
ncbi:tyrosine-type recombinase/integrase [Kocuria sabuli]|uniref:tyrosine-type recombinase/integrase n=1 Tax=Kocuria sabuli TaxID=3071448 RepID=UPI0034D664F0